MIVQDFYIPKYDWEVRVYYAVDCYYTGRIIADLRRVGCRGARPDGRFQEHALLQPEYRHNLFQCKGQTNRHGDSPHFLSGRVSEFMGP